MRSPSHLASRCLLALALAAAASPAPVLADGTRVRATTLITVDGGGDGSGDGGSTGRAATRNDATAVSPDGRYVAFVSAATDLGASPVSGTSIVYWRDLRTGRTRVVAASGAHPSISANGRYVAFDSTATNLVGGFADNNAAGSDVYVRDVTNAATALVSHQAGAATAGAVGSSSGPVISGDGSTIVYTDAGSVTSMVAGGPSDANGAPDLLAYAVGSGANALVTAADPAGSGTQPGTPGYFALSRDGHYVAYETTAAPTTVVAGLADGNGAGGDVYRRDLTNGATVAVSIGTTPGITGNADSGGAQPVRISDDGRYVAFASLATDLTPASDGNTALDVFVRDVDGASTTLASATPGGAAGNAASDRVVLSADGRHVAFVSLATDLVAGVADSVADDVFARDLTGTAGTTLVSGRADGASAQGGTEPSISDDGRYVAFASTGTNLIPGLNDGNSTTSDVFLRDLAAGELLLVSSIPSSGTTTADGASTQPWVSGDGRSVTFASAASNLVSPFTDRDGPGADLYERALKLDPSAGIDSTTAAGTAPLTVDFTATSASPDLAIGYAWDFGDGAAAGASSVTHTFTAAGDYTVTLRITDADGDVATATRAVSVAAAPAQPGPVIVPPDTTAPRLSLSGAKRHRVSTVRAHGLRGGVGANENCTVHLAVTVTTATARRLGLGATTTIGRLTRAVAGRVATAYVVHLTAAARRQLARHRAIRTVPITVTATGHDAAGNQAKAVRRTMTLTR